MVKEEGDFNNLDDFNGDIGEAEYSAKSDFSKAQLVYETFQKCIEKRAIEMKKGYYNTTFSVDGMPQKTWVSDTRKTFWSAVEALKCILMPEIIDSDDTTKTDITAVQKEMETLFNTYAYCDYTQSTENGRTTYKKSEFKYMPDVDQIVQVFKSYPDGTKVMTEKAGAWNRKIDAYWDQTVKHSDKLFQELMKIIHNKNYFKSKIRFG